MKRIKLVVLSALIAALAACTVVPSAPAIPKDAMECFYFSGVVHAGNDRDYATAEDAAKCLTAKGYKVKE